MLGEVEPVYEELPGWLTDISKMRRYSDLPENCRRYLDKITEVSGMPIGIISVGPEREQTILLEKMF